MRRGELFDYLTEKVTLSEKETRWDHNKLCWCCFSFLFLPLYTIVLPCLLHRVKKKQVLLPLKCFFSSHFFSWSHSISLFAESCGWQEHRARFTGSSPVPTFLQHHPPGPETREHPAGWPGTHQTLWLWFLCPAAAWGESQRSDKINKHTKTKTHCEPPFA